MKHRSVGLCVVLTIITCGIYGIYWLYCLNEEIGEVTEKPGTTGGMVILFSIVTCGIYLIYWSYKMGEKLDAARADQGVPTGSLAILYLVLSIIGLDIVNWALMQSEINHYIPGGDLEN